MPDLIKQRDKAGRFIPGISYSPATQFKPGERRNGPTEFKPGVHRSRATEFKPGQQAYNRLPVGSIRIRCESNTGLYRAWIKIADPNIWKKRAVLIWESVNGPLPKGWVVHHHDRNSLNDDIENLRGLSRRDHANEHRGELQAWFRN